MTFLLAALLTGVVPGPLEMPPLQLEPPPPMEHDRPARPPPAPEPPPPRQKNYLMSALQTGVILGTGTWWYWSSSAPEETWDLRFDLASWRRKLDGDALRFDADRFDTNASSHPRAGLYYYQVARGNGFSFAESYVWTAVASALWEYLIEWNENPSINDLILTPAGGAVMGESTFRLGSFFGMSSPTLANRTAATLFSPIAALDDLLTGRPRSVEGPFDALGFTQTMKHKFALVFDRLACTIDGKRSDQSAVSLDTAVVSHRGYRRPGHRTVTVGPGAWTELAARLFFDSDTVEGFNLHSSALVVGRYTRHYAERDPSESWRTTRPRGWGLLFGLGTAFDYHARELNPWLDKIVSAGLLGPTAELSAESGSFGVRLALSSYYSFAMVQSLAYMADASPASPLAVNTALRNQGYYYGHGVTSLGLLAFRIGDVELSVAADFGAYWSINGRDRFQERLESDISLSDTRSSGVAAAGVRPWGGPILIAGRLERLERIGHMGSSSASSEETRAGVGAGLIF